MIGCGISLNAFYHLAEVIHLLFTAYQYLETAVFDGRVVSGITDPEVI